MKKLLSVILSLVALFTTFTPLTARAAEVDTSHNAPIYSNIFEFMDDVSVQPEYTTYSGTVGTTKVIGSTTDSGKILALANKGLIDRNADGSLPSKVCATQILETPSINYPENELLRASLISISKSDHYDGRYFEDYDRYVIDGPSNFSQTYSRTSTVGWNTDMSGSIKVDGDIYTVAAVQSALSSSMGYTIGNSVTSTSNYNINVPSGKIWTIKVWTSYRVFTYTASVGSIKLASGQSWYPNGLVILHTESNA